MYRTCVWSSLNYAVNLLTLQSKLTLGHATFPPHPWHHLCNNKHARKDINAPDHYEPPPGGFGRPSQSNPPNGKIESATRRFFEGNNDEQRGRERDGDLNAESGKNGEGIKTDPPAFKESDTRVGEKKKSGDVSDDDEDDVPRVGSKTKKSQLRYRKYGDQSSIALFSAVLDASREHVREGGQPAKKRKFTSPTGHAVEEDYERGFGL